MQQLPRMWAHYLALPSNHPEPICQDKGCCQAHGDWVQNMLHMTMQNWPWRCVAPLLPTPGEAVALAILYPEEDITSDVLQLQRPTQASSPRERDDIEDQALRHECIYAEHALDNFENFLKKRGAALAGAQTGCGSSQLEGRPPGAGCNTPQGSRRSFRPSSWASPLLQRCRGEKLMETFTSHASCDRHQLAEKPRTREDP